MKLGDVIQVAGLAVVALGVGLFSVALGVVVAGVAMIAFGVALKIGE